jgi:hypothetical protein
MSAPPRAASDRKGGAISFVLAVERDRALDAFYHPSPTPPNASKSLP